jgi:hypothetical protein
MSPTGMLILEQGPLVAVEDDVPVAHLEAALKICLQGTTMEGMDPPTLHSISEVRRSAARRSCFTLRWRASRSALASLPILSFEISR